MSERDPFLITGPAVISFSGGRTSAYMLWRILQAHGGVLPNDVVVCFANTGREMPATLDFVRDCASAWGVHIRWLEYRSAERPTFEEVSHNSASRRGEPLEQLFKRKSALPNPVQRFCTEEAKVRTIKRFIQSEFGWSHWLSVVGLRPDEHKPERAPNLMARRGDCWDNFCPLYVAGICEPEIMAFWRTQSFDLRLACKHEGNCDGCFLKKREAIEYMFQHHSERMQWWPQMEATKHGVGAGGTFRADREDYATMARVVRGQGRLDLTAAELFEPCGVECVA